MATHSQPCSDFQKRLAVCKAVRLLLVEKHRINVRSLPFNVLFYNCTFTASGRGSTPLFFCFYQRQRVGCWQSVDVRFLCICVQFQCRSIFGWVPESTHYHFNHYPQRRGRGVKRPKKIVKILLPMFRQGCLVFTGRGSRCERERKLWCLFQTAKESAFFTLQFSIYLYSPEGNAALRGKGALEQSRRVGMDGTPLPYGWTRPPRALH